MSKRLEDLNTPANLLLFDLLFRHQVYLEGVKAGFANVFRAMLTQLYGEFAQYIGQTQHDTLDAFSRSELRQFVHRFQTAQQRSYNLYTQHLIDLLKQFVAIDVDITSAIYEHVTGQTTAQRAKNPQPDDLPSTHGVRRTRGTKASNELLWASIADSIVPANGLTIKQMLDSFTVSTTSKVVSAINMGYANGDKATEALSAIVGQRSNNFRDGLFSTFTNQNNALIATMLQHTSSIVQGAIASIHYNEYQWVSILDSKTTDICRSRNGNVYVYGEGPLPPAHWFCRSKAVSLTNGKELHNIPNTFYDWLITQPETLLLDMVGRVAAARIVAGSSSAKDISITELVNPLTLGQFHSKIDHILM